jgi:hypothetical protein
MAVLVKSGHGLVPGSEGAKQGVYAVANDADVTVSLTAAHATLNRIDIIVFQVRDQAYSGANNDCLLTKVDGTPSGSPSAPAAPNNSLVLAQVFVGAAVGSVTNANITDRRTFLSAIGGIIVCTSTTQPTFVPEGQVIYETDTDYLKAYNGATWVQQNQITNYKQQTVAETRTSNTTLALSNTLFTPTLDASTTWEIEFHLIVSGIQAADFKTDWSSPAGATAPGGGSAIRMSAGPAVATTDRDNTLMTIHSSNFTTTIPYGCDTVGSPIYVTERSVVLIGATPGVVGIRWAQNTSNATGTNIAAGSYMKWTKI